MHMKIFIQYSTRSLLASYKVCFYDLCLTVYGTVVYSCGDQIFVHFVGFLSLGMLLPNTVVWKKIDVKKFSSPIRLDEN